MHTAFSLIAIAFLFSCSNTDTVQTKAAISALSLKRGDIIACGPPDKEFGTVRFLNACSPGSKKDFDLGVALLHSFEYDEAEKAFAKAIDADPQCAMAYWGVAMSNYHQVWPTTPSAEELAKGSKAITIAQSLSKGATEQAAYVNAMAAFYMNYKTLDHRTRVQAYLKAMEGLHHTYPADREAAVFYALALVGAADASDKTYSNQKKAGEILNSLYPGEPDHPGIVHYLIHAYDSPELAALALPAARKYAAIAPSSAHAQHMPSHIFTRLGLWDEALRSNAAAASSAKCYAESAGIKGHWDEELHALDYLVYAYLQKGDNASAKQQLDYLKTIQKIEPANFKVAYAYAAAPARYFLENKMWKEAASLEVYPSNVSWQKFPWQKAIVHFTRLLGNAHTQNATAANEELTKLKVLRDTLVAQKDSYKANQVAIQIKAGEAWIAFAEGKKEEAWQRMAAAADEEDKTEKAPVTPGEVLPAKELLADMLLQLNKPGEALAAYDADLKKHPKRFNGLYGAGLASEKLNDGAKAADYYRQMVSVAGGLKTDRPELQKAKDFLVKNHLAHLFK